MARSAPLADLHGGDLLAGEVDWCGGGERSRYQREGKPLENLEPPVWVRAEPEWAAALHLLSSPLLRSKGCLRAVDFDRRWIDFPGLAERAGPWSHGERILLCAAWALFNGGDRAAFAGLLDGDLLSEAVSALSGANVRQLIEAVRLRRPEADQL